jgi:hypothetical protein
LIPRPWRNSPEQIASAEDAVRGLVGDDVARLLRPALRPEHVPVVEMLERLAWSVGPVEVIADEAVKILAASTKPGGIIDPKDDDADVGHDPQQEGHKRRSRSPSSLGRLDGGFR